MLLLALMASGPWRARQALAQPTPAPTDAQAQAQAQAQDQDQGQTPDQRLELAQQAYQRADYAQLRQLLEPMLKPRSRYEQQADRVEARTLLAAGAFFEALSAREAAERDALLELAQGQLLELLRERPDHTLDTLLYPVSFIDLFEDVKSAHREELDRLRANQRGLGSGQALGQHEPIYIERAIIQRSYALNFAPFGLGQLHSGQTTKGVLLAAGQGLALTLNVVSYFNILALRGTQRSPFYYDTGPDGLSGNYAAALTWRNTMYISLGVFAALWALGVADALYGFEPEQLRHLRTLEAPPPELAPTRPGLPEPEAWLRWGWSF